MKIPARQSSVIALLVAGALFMEQLDGTVIATALPQMANTFEVAPVDLNIGISAYLLTVAVFIPASGWVTDRFGARVVFGSAIATFTIASILCAASGTLFAFTSADPSGDRRRDDGSGRPPHRVAQHRKAGPDPGHRLSHLAGIDRAGGRPAARRTDHDVQFLA